MQPWADLAAIYGIEALNLPGGPTRDYELLLGLWLNQERTKTQRAYLLLRAIRDARYPVVPVEYLAVEYDDPDDAQAIYNLMSARAEYEMAYSD